MTIRNLFLAGVSAVALLACCPAQAQLAVIDGANLTQTAKSVVQGAQQIEQLAQQLQTMQQQLATAEQTFQSLAHAPADALQSAAGQFNVPSLRNILPSNNGQVAAILNGTGPGNAGPLGTQNFNANHIYTPTGNDFAATQIVANANSIAGIQALAQNLYQSAAQHITVMQDLEGQLNNSPDQKTTSDLQTRIAAEQTYLQAQQVQAASLQALQQAQVRNVEQQADEKQRQNIDEVLSQSPTSTPGT